MNPAVWLLVGLCMAAVVWLAGTLAAGGRLEVGQITAVAEYAILTLSYLIMAARHQRLPAQNAILPRSAGGGAGDGAAIREPPRPMRRGGRTRPPSPSSM